MSMEQQETAADCTTVAQTPWQWYRELGEAWMALDGSPETVKRANLALAMLGVMMGMHSADAKDAARYRWLRDPENGDGPGILARCAPEELDAELDALLAARECGNAGCGWQGRTDRMCGSIGPLCPDCGEVTEPAAISRIRIPDLPHPRDEPMLREHPYYPATVVQAYARTAVQQDRAALVKYAKDAGWGMRDDSPMEEAIEMLWEEIDRA